MYILPVSFARKAHLDSYLPLKEQVVRTQAQITNQINFNQYNQTSPFYK